MTSSAAFSYAQAAKGLSVTKSSPSAKQTPSAASANDSESVSNPANNAVPSPESKAANGTTPVDAVALKETLVTNASISQNVQHAKDEQSQTNGVLTPASPEFGTSSTATLLKDDDQSSANPTASDTTWDSKSVASAAVGSEKPDLHSEKSGTKEDVKDGDAETLPSKLFSDAPPPAINFWTRRAEARASAATPSVKPQPNQAVSGSVSERSARSATGKGAAEDKSNSSPAEKKANSSAFARSQSESKNGSSRRSEDDGSKSKVSAPPRATSREEKADMSPPLPPTHDQESWPTPETAEKDEKKKGTEKTEKPEDNAQEKKKPHGKNAWVSMAFTPSALFNTPLPTSRRGGHGEGRGGRGGRGGRENSTRGGSATSVNGSPNTDKGSAPLSSMSNGDSPRRGRPNAPAQSQSTAGAKTAEPSPTVATETAAIVATPNDASKRDSSPTKNEGLPYGSQQPHAAANQTPTGNGYGSTRGNGRGRGGRRGEFSASSERRRDYIENPSMSADVPARTGRRESVATSEGRHERRISSVSEDPFGQSKSQPYERRNGPYSTYPNAQERMSARTRGPANGRGGRGGSHPYQNGTPNTHLANGQSPYSQYGYASSRSSPSWQSEHQNQYYSPQQSQSSRTYRASSSRTQSVSTENTYPRYNANYGMPPHVTPIQTFMSTNMYDPLAPQPMTATPYSPYHDQFSLLAMVSMQLEYYFSVDNLCKDVYLRKNMDSQGFVPLALVAEFNRIKKLTTDLELVKYVCFQSPIIEWRVGADGMDWVRPHRGWEQWVLPTEERNESAQNAGPSELRQPPVPTVPGFEQPRQPFPNMPATAGPTSAPWNTMNGGPAPYGSPMSPTGSQNGPYYPPLQQMMTNGYGAYPGYMPDAQAPAAPHPSLDPEADTFSDNQAQHLTVIVKKSEGEAAGTPSEHQDSGATVNGAVSSTGRVDPDLGSRTTFPTSSCQRAYWMKDNDHPVDSLPAFESDHERYPDFRRRALLERDESPRDVCPSNLAILYNFWSHFLLRYFNANMYEEFRRLALADARERGVNDGLMALLEYYRQALASDLFLLRIRVAEHYAALARQGMDKADEAWKRLAFEQLRSQWQSGLMDPSNRMRLEPFLVNSLKAALEEHDR